MSTQQPDTLESLRSAYALGYIDATTYRTVRRALVAAIAQGVRLPSPLAPPIQAGPTKEFRFAGDDATVRPITEVISLSPGRATGTERPDLAKPDDNTVATKSDDAGTSATRSPMPRNHDVPTKETAADSGTHGLTGSETARSKKNPLLLGALAIFAIAITATLQFSRAPAERDTDQVQNSPSGPVGTPVPETPAAIERLVTRSEWNVGDLENARQAIRELKPTAGTTGGPGVLAGLRGAVQERINLETELARSGHRDAAFDAQLAALAQELDLPVGALTGSADGPSAEAAFTTSPSVADPAAMGTPPPASNTDATNGHADVQTDGSNTAEESNTSPSIAAPGPTVSVPRPPPAAPHGPAAPEPATVKAPVESAQPRKGGAEGNPPAPTHDLAKAGTRETRTTKDERASVADSASTATRANSDQAPRGVQAARPSAPAGQPARTASGIQADPQRTQTADDSKVKAGNAPAASVTVTETPPASPTKRVAAKGNCDEITLTNGSKSLYSRSCADGVDAAPGPTLSVIALGNGFRMGGNNPDELPVHDVVLARPFAIGKFEVSVMQYSKFVADTGTVLRDQPANSADAPVVNVTWDEAVRYCDWLSKKSGAIYRLPSEAEWEWAARAGEQTRWPGSDKDINAAAIHGSVLGKKSKPRSANMGPAPKPFGLVNMLGNVREWVQDSWQPGYAGAPVDGQPVNGSGTKVVRGGSFRSDREDLRLGARQKLESSSFDDETGFRVVRELRGR